jgi:hypothetical protein
LRWLDGVKTDIRTLSIKKSMHKYQHGDKNGGEFQGRFRSEPKDQNAIDGSYFYNFVLNSGKNLKC